MIDDVFSEGYYDYSSHDCVLSTPLARNDMARKSPEDISNIFRLDYFSPELTGCDFDCLSYSIENYFS